MAVGEAVAARPAAQFFRETAVSALEWFPFQIPAILQSTKTGWTRPVGRYIWIDGKRLLSFSGTNYLGLANHPSAKIAAAAAIWNQGLSVSASRVTTGTHPLHLALERSLARFMGTDDAVISSSGGHANQILIEALAKPDAIFFCEKSAHPSLKAAIPHENQRSEFDCEDLEFLRRALKNVNSGFILINGVHPLTGVIAPLRKIIASIPVGKKINLIVDDAHGVFVLGPNGRGTVEHCGLEPENIFQTGTLSKALGSFGGFIVGSQPFCDRLRKTAAYRGATALPPGITAGALANLEQVERQGWEWRTRLSQLAAHAAEKINLLGYKTKFYGTPILLLVPPSSISPQSVSSRLLQHGIFLPLIDYPDSSTGGKLRWTLSAKHTPNDIERFYRALPTNH